MKVNLDFIENILKNPNKFEYWGSNLDQFGIPADKDSGLVSYEFEITDQDDRLWGGRIVKIEENFELVEFFCKMFYSDYNPEDWEGFDLDGENEPIEGS